MQFFQLKDIILKRGLLTSYFLVKVYVWRDTSRSWRYTSEEQFDFPKWVQLLLVSSDISTKSTIAISFFNMIVFQLHRKRNETAVSMDSQQKTLFLSLSNKDHDYFNPLNWHSSETSYDHNITNRCSTIRK